ncbi:hypothetical protein [Agromyces sp. SYSU T00194]|uniref:hypothetical protein n=1 Tax=Agromyces chitinivorans TaxID=3158560 RepID=UPI003393B69B
MPPRVPAAEPVFARAVSSASLAASAACVAAITVIAVLSVVFRSGEWALVAVAAVGWFLGLGVAVALVALRPSALHRVVLLVVGTTVVYAATDAVMTLDAAMADTNTLRTALPGTAMLLAVGATRRSIASIAWTTAGYLATGGATLVAAHLGGFAFHVNVGTTAVFVLVVALRLVQRVAARRRPEGAVLRRERAEQALTRVYERSQARLAAIAAATPGRLPRTARARIAEDAALLVRTDAAPSAAAADPAGGRVAWWALCGGGVVALVVATTTIIGHRDEMRLPGAAALAAVLLAAAWTVAIESAARRRSPMPGDRYGLAVALAIAAALAENVSTQGANTLLYDDFGPALAALLIVLLAPFASWRTAAAVGAAAVIATGAIAAGAAAFVPIAAPVLTFAVVSATPVAVAVSAAVGFSATFAHFVTRRDRTTVATEFARRRAAHADRPVAVAAPGAGHDGAAAECVDRIELLDAEVLPFLRAVATSGRLRSEDIAIARRLGARLRVASACRTDATWLDDLARLESGHAIRVRVDDPAGIADRLDATQRDCLASLIEAVARQSRRGSVEVRLDAPEPGEWKLAVQAPPPAAGAAPRLLDTMVQALRAVFDRAALISDPDAVRVVLRHRDPPQRPTAPAPRSDTDASALAPVAAQLR